MYENVTYEMILERMMEKIPSTIDKREGSVIYDALAPAALELKLMYIELDVVLNETFGDTASRPYLIKRAAERGIAPKPAAKAVLKGAFNIDVPIGSRYSLENLNYIAKERIGGGVFRVECESEGADGNRQFGRLIPIDYVRGLEKAELTELLIPGEDEEATEAFRRRYLNSFNNQAYGGNMEDYKQKVHAIQGIGGVKVHPVWNGGGTVKLVVMDSEYRRPSDQMVETVQTMIDPVPNHGEGLGVAPIGHWVTVKAVETETIHIQLRLTLGGGFVFADIKSGVEQVIDAYLLSLNAKWEDTDRIVVRISQIESRLLEISEIVDIEHTAINGNEENYIVDTDAIAVRGEVSAGS